MPKSSAALTQMPPSTLAALQQLGADLAVARLRRKESLKTWAQRLGVSVPTLLRLEAGQPTVSLGVLATALWLVGRDAALATLATPQEDRGALEMDVRQAQKLGQERMQASQQAQHQRAEKRALRSARSDGPAQSDLADRSSQADQQVQPNRPSPQGRS
jgi:transcriptional regulator with XRE-family HTH domain